MRLLVGVSIFLVACSLGSVRAQTHSKQDEIPIEHCDRLPVVTVKVEGEKKPVSARYSSYHGPQPEVFHIERVRKDPDLFMEWKRCDQRPWSFLRQVELGRYKLHDLKLAAIDLSQIGKACGGQIDGILGVDLIDRMGMTIDLKRRVALVAPSVEPRVSTNEIAETPRHVNEWYGDFATTISVDMGKSRQIVDLHLLRT